MSSQIKFNIYSMLLCLETKCCPNVVSALLIPGYLDLSIWWKQFYSLSFHFSRSLSVNSTSLVLVQKICHSPSLVLTKTQSKIWGRLPPSRYVSIRAVQNRDKVSNVICATVSSIKSKVSALSQCHVEVLIINTSLWDPVTTKNLHH